MTLSHEVPALLDKCAHAIALGKERDINLTALFPTFYRKDGMVEIVTTLIEGVEHYSDEARSVRLADKELFKHKHKIIGLYLVCCPVDTPTGIVYEATEDMQLVSLRPFGNGLIVGAERALYNKDAVSLSLALETYLESR
jgi:hypothetical protein